MWSGYSARRRLQTKARTAPQLRRPLRKNQSRLPPPANGRRPVCQKDAAKYAAASWVSGPGKPVNNMRFSKSHPGRGLDQRLQAYPVPTLANDLRAGKDLIRHRPDATTIPNRIFEAKNFCHHDNDRDPAGSFRRRRTPIPNSTFIMRSGEFE